MRASVVVALVLFLGLFPVPLAAQAGGEFRPYAFVLLAYAAAWVLIGLWAFTIGRRLRRLESSPPPPRADDR